jgi:hypothetical protein
MLERIAQQIRTATGLCLDLQQARVAGVIGIASRRFAIDDLVYAALGY